MEKIVANLPELLNAANNINTYIDEFRDQKTQTDQASQTLREMWEGAAAEKYLDTMAQMTAWMEQMSAVLDDYPAALREIEGAYRDADEAGARAFGR